MNDIEKIKLNEIKQLNNKDNSFVSRASSVIASSVASVENIDLVPDFIDDVINDIYDAFGSDKLTKDTGINCLKENEITGIGIQDILSVTRYGREEENIKVILKEGSQYEFVLKDGNHVIDTVILVDGTVIKCNLSSIVQDAIRGLNGIYDEVEVKGHATLNINGVDMKLYWLEDENKSFQDFIQFISICREGLEVFPSNILKKIAENGFKGIFFGASGSREDNVASYVSNWAAYAFSDDFIFVNNCFKVDAITHEFGHVLDDFLVDGEYKKFSHYDQELQNLYEQYKKIVQPLEINYSGYGSSEEYPDGIPTATEFFTIVNNLFLNHGEDLYALIPELYDYFANFYNNI